MHVSKIVLTLGCTINTGNYENIRRDVQVEVVPGDSSGEALFVFAEDKARTFLAESLIDDFHASFDVTYFWRSIEDMGSLRERMDANHIFSHIAANDSRLASTLVSEQWGKLEAYQRKMQIVNSAVDEILENQSPGTADDDYKPF